MAFSLARAAGAGIRRSTTPVVASGSTSFYGKVSYRPSYRISDVPFEKIADHFKGWTAEELVWARRVIDGELKKKGLTVIKTGSEARTESMFRIVSELLLEQRADVSFLKNKKGDITSINIGKLGTVNGLSLFTLLLRVEEMWPMMPVIQAWIEKAQG